MSKVRVYRGCWSSLHNWKRNRSHWLLWCSLAMLIAICVTPISAKEYCFLLGDSTDVQPRLFGPVLNLEGGGAPAEGAMQRTVDTVRRCAGCRKKVDIVVLSWVSEQTVPQGTDAIWNKRFYQLNGVDSVETIIVSGESPVSSETVKKISNAEIVYFQGGSQCDYTRHFRGTNIEKAVEAVYERGGAVGGTSAGQAIQGSIVFNGCEARSYRGFLTSEAALQDPYDERISFSHDFFNWNYMEDTIADQHFVKRDRFGRTLAFIARQIQDGLAKIVYGIGVDEGTSVIVDKKGRATVVAREVSVDDRSTNRVSAYAGENAAYFILADHKPEICKKGMPLTYSDFKVWKVSRGGTFNLRNRPASGFYTVSVLKGKLSRNPY